MADITIFEINLGDGELQFGPKTIGGDLPSGTGQVGSDGTADSDSDGADDAGRSCPCPCCDDGCDCRACKCGKTALAFGLLVAVAVVAWRLFGDSDLGAVEELDELDE